MQDDYVLEAEVVATRTHVVYFDTVILAKGVLDPDVPVNRIWIFDLGWDPVSSICLRGSFVLTVIPLPPPPEFLLPNS